MNNCCDYGPAPTTLPPSGPAGGDLEGTYPDPQVKWEKADAKTIPPGALADGAIPVGTTIPVDQVTGFKDAAAASLRNCAGQPHQANDTVPTCAEMNNAIDAAVEEGTKGFITRVITDETMSGDGTATSPLHVKFPVIPDAGLSAVAVGCGLTGTGTVGDPITLDSNTQWTNCAGELLCGPQKLPTCSEMEHAIDWHAIPVELPLTGNGQPDKPLGIDCEQLKTICGIPGVGDIHEGPGISVEVDGTHSVRVSSTGVATNSPITGSGLPNAPLDIDCAALVAECGLLTAGKVHQGANVSITATPDGGISIAAAGGGGGGPAGASGGGWHAVAMASGVLPEAGAGNLMVIGPPGAQFDDPEGSAADPRINVYTVGANGMTGITVMPVANGTIKVLYSNRIAVAWFSAPLTEVPSGA